MTVLKIHTTDSDLARLMLGMIERGSSLEDALSHLFGTDPVLRDLSQQERVLDIVRQSLGIEDSDDDAQYDEDYVPSVVTHDPEQLFFDWFGPEETAQRIDRKVASLGEETPYETILRITRPANRWEGDEERYIML